MRRPEQLPQASCHHNREERHGQYRRGFSERQEQEQHHRIAINQKHAEIRSSEEALETRPTVQDDTKAVPESGRRGLCIGSGFGRGIGDDTSR